MTSKTSNYVAAWVDYGRNGAEDKVIVLERDQHGKLSRLAYNSPFYFYIEDKDGEFESIFGHKVTRAEFRNRNERDEALKYFRDSRNFPDEGRCPALFETDIPPLKRVLMDNYYDRPAPPVNFAFIDIEADYTRTLGFPSPSNAYAIINAVTVYQSWTKKFVTLAIPPKEFEGTLDDVNAEVTALVEQGELREGFIPEIILCDNETELATMMLQLIAEADIVSGWNSEFYDMPYIHARLEALGNGLVAKLEYPGVRPPRKEMVNKFGTEEPVIKFSGRSHLDYMRLFQKFTFEGRTSYSLGNILQEEVGVGKIEFDGTLEELYHNNFPKFVAYNFRDVDGLVQLDAKFKFIALANQMAHENTVGFEAVMGTVSYVETGIANHAHYVLKKVVHDKNIKEHDKVEGAIVLNPKIGLHEWIGSVDIASLYPNTIRSLNISPEKIVGQFNGKESAWEQIRKQTEERICFTFESGQQEMKSAKEWHSVLAENMWAISAYGTVFDQSSGRGVVADILGFWYNERKRLQAEKKKYSKLAIAETDPVKKQEYTELEEHFDLLQLTKKITMNSLYGALLNVAFRFGDERMGASVTASGRGITTHMMETMAFLLTGERTPLIKHVVFDEDEGKFINTYTSDSDAIIYGDTDSCYYKTFGSTKEEAIEIADAAADGLNASFPAFMREAFNCQPEYDTLIKAGREIVGIRGLFQAKKKYMIKVVDNEGFAVDKMKSQGSEIKKADTPKIIQKFLKQAVDMILDGQSYDDLAEYVNEQRLEILKNKLNTFALGVAKQVNNLDKYWAEYEVPGTFRSKSGGKLTIPGHARASCNYNRCIGEFDPGGKLIKSGDKVAIYYLKKNPQGFKAMAFPSEFTRFPDWFIEHFKVDIKTTEDRMFDSKLGGVFSAAYHKEVPTPQSVLTNSLLEF